MSEFEKLKTQKEAILLKGFDIERIAARVHDAWMETKRTMGFHGPSEPCIAELYNFAPCTGIARCRTFHADLIPYEQLTEAKKELDRATVRTVLKAMKEVSGHAKLVREATEPLINEHARISRSAR